MNYTKEELGFILYNNRSVKGVVNNFLSDDINPFKVINIERKFNKSKSLYVSDSRMVEVNLSEIDTECDDVIVNKEDLESLTNLFIKNKGKFSENEYNYLIGRGCDVIIEKYDLLGLSNIKDYKNLETIGATCHPTLKKILVDGIKNGGIIIPLFENGVLVNCAIRKIAIENTDKKSLKYSLACPDIPVWGLDNINEGDEVWLTEGVFDMMAIQTNGEKCVSCSSTMWSGVQLYKVLKKKPSKINIFSDSDEVGLRTSAILKDFFMKSFIDCEIYISKSKLDASDHFFQMKDGWDNVDKINVTKDLIGDTIDNSFDFINHLKNRKY